MADDDQGADVDEGQAEELTPAQRIDRIRDERAHPHRADPGDSIGAARIAWRNRDRHVSHRTTRTEETL